MFLSLLQLCFRVLLDFVFVTAWPAPSSRALRRACPRVCMQVRANAVLRPDFPTGRHSRPGCNPSAILQESAWICPSGNCPPSGNLRPSHLGAGSAAWLPFPGQPGPDPDFGDACGDTLHHFTIENVGHDVFRTQLLARNSFHESQSP